MSAKSKQMMMMAFIALVVAGLVTWASNNVDAVDDLIG